MDPRKVAAFGLLGLAMLLTVALRAGDLPLINPARTSYSAEFSDAGGLKAGDTVQISGVRVGEVTGIEVDQDRVVVAFDLDEGVDLGKETTAAVKVSSLLGAKYLEVEPAGTGTLAEDAVIPLERTTPAYDVVAAFADLTNIEQRLDVDGVATALDTMAATFRDAPSHVRSALRGLTRLSETVASRDGEIKELIRHANATAKVLDERRGDISTLVASTNLLLEELERRKAVIHRLLVNTIAFSQELSGLIRDNQATLAPALTRLEQVTDVLLAHQQDLRAVIRNLDTYGSTFNNVIGTGPWFDVVIPRLPNSVQEEN